MKKLLWLFPLSASFHCVLTYAWLFIANSSSPSPAKELILLFYALVIALLFWRLNTIKEMGNFAGVSGLVNGVFGLVLVMTFFPRAFHDVDVQTEKAPILFTGGAMLVALYFIAGLFIDILHGLVSRNAKT
jgi:hypothetical protein